MIINYPDRDIAVHINATRGDRATIELEATDCPAFEVRTYLNEKDIKHKLYRIGAYLNTLLNAGESNIQQKIQMAV